MKWFLGIDGGATKTEACITNEYVDKIALAYSGPSNYQTVGIKRAIKNIEKATIQACRAVNIEPPVDYACIALAGINSPLDYETMISELSKLDLFAKLRVIHDGEAALYAATRGKKGIIVILGTGSLVAAYDNKGNYIRACNWGHLLGDEGSAYRIVIKTFSRILKGYDGRLSKIKTQYEILEILKIKNPSDLASIVYTKMNNEDIAKLAPFIIQKAMEDEEILKILENEAEQVAECVKVIHEKTGWDEVYLTGGLTKNFFYVNLVEKEIKKKINNIKIKILEVKPILGTILLMFDEEKIQEENAKKVYEILLKF